MFKRGSEELPGHSSHLRIERIYSRILRNLVEETRATGGTNSRRMIYDGQSFYSQKPLEKRS